MVAADALGDDAAALVVGGGVVAAASGVAWCISVSPAAVPPPATTRTAAAIAAHIRRLRRGRSPLPGPAAGGSTVVAPPEGGAVSHGAAMAGAAGVSPHGPQVLSSLVGAGLSSLVRSGACGGWSKAVGAVTQSDGRPATGRATAGRTAP